MDKPCTLAVAKVGQATHANGVLHIAELATYFTMKSELLPPISVYKQLSILGHSSNAAASTTAKTRSFWRDPTLWVSVGIAVLLLGAQGVRVGLFGRIFHWVPYRHSQREEVYDQL